MIVFTKHNSNQLRFWRVEHLGNLKYMHSQYQNTWCFNTSAIILCIRTFLALTEKSPDYGSQHQGHSQQLSVSLHEAQFKPAGFFFSGGHLVNLKYMQSQTQNARCFNTSATILCICPFLALAEKRRSDKPEVFTSNDNNNTPTTCECR